MSSCTCPWTVTRTHGAVTTTNFASGTGAAIDFTPDDDGTYFVTVTAVETSPDLRHARVFVSVLGSKRKRTATLEGLGSSHGVLQAAVNRELHLKRTPQLSFEYDPTVEEGVRLTKLIDERAPDANADES